MWKPPTTITSTGFTESSADHAAIGPKQKSSMARKVNAKHPYRSPLNPPRPGCKRNRRLWHSCGPNTVFRKTEALLEQEGPLDHQQAAKSGEELHSPRSDGPPDGSRTVLSQDTVLRHAL